MKFSSSHKRKKFNSYQYLLFEEGTGFRSFQVSNV